MSDFSDSFLDSVDYNFSDNIFEELLQDLERDNFDVDFTFGNYAAIEDLTVPKAQESSSSSAPESSNPDNIAMIGAFDPSTNPWVMERDSSPPLPNNLQEHIIAEIRQEEARREEEERERHLLSSIGSIPVHLAGTELPAVPFPPKNPHKNNPQNDTHNNSHKRKTTDTNIGITATFGTPKNSFSNASPKILRTLHPLISFPITLFQAFNGGDLKRVRELIMENTTRNCTLKTPALESEIYGNSHISDLFNALSEAHPDAVFVAKKVKFNEELSELSCRIYFAGTRVSSTLRSLDMTSSHSEYLFKRPGSSLTDEMDVSQLTKPEISAMQELERKSLNLSVFGKGRMALLVDNNAGRGSRSRSSSSKRRGEKEEVEEEVEKERITRFHLDWVITSFREAVL